MGHGQSPFGAGRDVVVVSKAVERSIYFEIALALFSHALGSSSLSQSIEYGNLYVGIEYEGQRSRWPLGPVESPYVTPEAWASAIALWLRELQRGIR